MDQLLSVVKENNPNFKNKIIIAEEDEKIGHWDIDRHGQLMVYQFERNSKKFFYPILFEAIYLLDLSTQKKIIIASNAIRSIHFDYNSNIWMKGFEFIYVYNKNGKLLLKHSNTNRGQFMNIVVSKTMNKVVFNYFYQSILVTFDEKYNFTEMKPLRETNIDRTVEFIEYGFIGITDKSLFNSSLWFITEKGERRIDNTYCDKNTYHYVGNTFGVHYWDYNHFLTTPFLNERHKVKGQQVEFLKTLCVRENPESKDKLLIFSVSKDSLCFSDFSRKRKIEMDDNPHIKNFIRRTPIRGEYNYDTDYFYDPERGQIIPRLGMKCMTPIRDEDDSDIVYIYNPEKKHIIPVLGMKRMK